VKRSRWIALVLALATSFAAGASTAARAGTSGTALLTEVQVADHGTFDRVTFVFRSGIPEVLQVSYFTGPADLTPSGEPLQPPLLGDARFTLTLSNASGVDLSMNPFVDVYLGPDRIQPDLPGLVDLALLGDFEATMNWAFGLPDGQVATEVRVESSPTRVVVDIPHPAPRPVVVQPSFTG
jgi:hypothetical protein